MNIQNVEKKLGEARFALEQMIKQEPFREEEKFDLYLTGFLAAGMSVRGAFHVEQDRKRNEAVKRWKTDWEARLSPEERCLWDFMRKDRNHQVHRRGSSRTLKRQRIEKLEPAPTRYHQGPMKFRVHRMSSHWRPFD